MRRQNGTNCHRLTATRFQLVQLQQKLSHRPGISGQELYLAICRIVPSTKTSIVVAYGIQFVSMRPFRCILALHILAQIEIMNRKIYKCIEFVFQPSAI